MLVLFSHFGYNEINIHTHIHTVNFNVLYRFKHSYKFYNYLSILTISKFRAYFFLCFVSAICLSFCSLSLALFSDAYHVTEK